MGVLLSVAAILLAQTVSGSDLSTLVTRIERAVVVADREALQQCRTELEQTGAEDTPTVLERYTLAYAFWRESFLVRDGAKKRKKLLKEAQATLESIAADEPDHVESLSLLGAVYGSQITGMWSGMTLGPKSTRALKRAEALAPDNPRVAFQLGVSAFRSPKAFGGSLERAEEQLRKAERLFAAETELQPWPNWGRVDVQSFLGQVLAKGGDLTSAREAYEKGLSIEPESAWIRDGLLPQLAELEAGADGKKP